DVSETSRGNNDYWVIYLDPDGNKKWDKRFGGNQSDVLSNIFQTIDGGYMITGHSSSGFTGDKQTTNWGENDFWILKTQCILDIDFGGDNSVCLGDSIMLNAYDPNCEGCIFDWWDGQSQDSIRTVIPTADGRYAVTLTDCVGCQTKEEIEVRVLQPPVIELGNDVEICPGTSHNFSPGNNADWDYLWSTGETTASINVSTAGTFSVTVTDRDGCESIDEVNTTLHDLTATTSVVNTTCYEANGSATVNPAGGTGSYNVTWSNGGSGNTISNVPSGKYTAIIDDGFCQLELDVIVGFQEDPVVEWARTFGGSQNDKGREVISTADGGYIVVGETRSTDGDVAANNGSIDYWVVKLAADGSIEWEKNYGGSREDSGRAISPTSDGGYIIGGSSNSSDGDVGGNRGELDFWIVKITADGTIQWEKNLGGSESDDFRDVMQTYDGGYIVSGITSSDNGDVGGNYGPTDVWLVKLNATGDIEWEQHYGNNENDGGFIKLRQAYDGGYLIASTNSSAGGDVSANNGSIDYWLIKTDGAGGIEWERSFGGTGVDLSNALDLTNDGGIIVAGSSNQANGDVNANNGSNDFWVIRLDAGGNIIWSQNYGGSASDVSWSVDALDDGSFIITGFSTSTDGDINNPKGGLDYWVIKIDNN
ncbi:MAG: SprB repeat-containing protein, partial [Bacteroidota bacterium]